MYESVFLELLLFRWSEFDYRYHNRLTLRMLSSQSFVSPSSASISSLNPTATLPSTTQVVTINGALLPNITSDANGVLVAASCPASPTILAGTSTTNAFSSSSLMTATITTVAAAAGSYLLCVRFTSSSSYSSAGSFSIISLTSWTPAIIPATSTVQSIALTGVGMTNMISDCSAYVLAASCSATSISAVTSISSSFTSSTSVTLSINDYGAVAGVYTLCLRLSSTSNYIATSLTMTIG